MSVNPANGRHECDRCGHDLKGGGIAQCALVSTYDEDRPGTVLTLEYCRDRPADETEGAEDGATGEVVKGCARRLTTPSMVAHYKTMQEATSG